MYRSVRPAGRGWRALTRGFTLAGMPVCYLFHMCSANTISHTAKWHTGVELSVLGDVGEIFVGDLLGLF